MADPLGGLLTLAASVLLPTGILGAMLWNQASQGRRLGAARRDWAKLATRRGLVGGGRRLAGGAWQLSYSGSIRGRSVTLSGLTPRPITSSTHVRARLHPPLDLGLHVGPDPDSHIPRIGTTRPLVVTDEPDRVIALFDADLATRVRALGSVDWTIDDGGVQARIPAFVTDLRSIDGLVQQVLDLCDALDRARTRIPAAGPLRGDVATWARFASDHRFDLLTAPLAMAGTLDGVAVTASARRVDRMRYGLGAEARFARPLGGVVSLVPTAAAAPAAWVEGSIEDPDDEDWLLDDARFDAAFRVRSRAPSRLARILPPDVRARLLRIHERTPLVLDDVGIHVAAERLPTAAEIPRLLAALASVAGAVEAAVRTEGASPYR